MNEGMKEVRERKRGTEEQVCEQQGAGETRRHLGRDPDVLHPHTLAES